MIIDHIDNADCYAALLPGLAEAFRFLRQAYARALEGDYVAQGRHELAGGNYVNADCYETRRENPNGLEAHRRYADVQLLLSGRERIRVRPLSGLAPTQPYDAARDVAFFAAEGFLEGGADICLREGCFALFLPSDAHEPQLCVDAPQPVRKLVAKVAVG